MHKNTVDIIGSNTGIKISNHAASVTQDLCNAGGSNTFHKSSISFFSLFIPLVTQTSALNILFFMLQVYLLCLTVDLSVVSSVWRIFFSLAHCLLLPVLFSSIYAVLLMKLCHIYCMYMFICLSIYLFVFVYLSIYVCLFVYISLSICLSAFYMWTIYIISLYPRK